MYTYCNYYYNWLPSQNFFTDFESVHFLSDTILKIQNERKNSKTSNVSKTI